MRAVQGATGHEKHGEGRLPIPIMPDTVPSALAMGVEASMHAEAGRASTHPLCGGVGMAPRFPLHSCRTPYFCMGLDSV